MSGHASCIRIYHFCKIEHKSRSTLNKSNAFESEDTDEKFMIDISKFYMTTALTTQSNLLFRDGPMSVKQSVLNNR